MQENAKLPRVAGFHILVQLHGRFVTAAAHCGWDWSQKSFRQLRRKALEIAEEIAKLPPLTVMQIRTPCSRADVPLSSALQIERKAHELMYGTQDMREGTNAFAEKRKPDFKGL